MRLWNKSLSERSEQTIEHLVDGEDLTQRGEQGFGGITDLMSKQFQGFIVAVGRPWVHLLV